MFVFDGLLMGDDPSQIFGSCCVQCHAPGPCNGPWYLFNVHQNDRTAQCVRNVTSPGDSSHVMNISMTENITVGALHYETIQFTFDSTGAAIRASDAFTESLAKDLRRSLAKFGVGVTLARRRERPPPLAWLRAKRKQEPDDVAADGDRLVAAILRGDAHVSLHAEPTWHDLD